MGTLNDGQRWELRDEAGTRVGTFVPDGEMARMEARMKELETSLARAQADGEIYRKGLEAQLKAQVTPVTQEELDDLQQNGVSGEQFMAEVERLFPQGPGKEPA